MRINVKRPHFLEKALNPQQQEAVLHTEGPLLVLAGAGTGKTRVITYRIAYLLSKGIPPQNILAVTFTNKTAEEMRLRVEKLVPASGRDVWISTFHSLAARILRRELKNNNFIIYDETDQKNLIKQCLKDLDINEKKYKLRMFYEAIGRAKDDLIDPDSYSIYASAENDLLRQLVSDVYTLYQKKLQSNNGLDFGDLLLRVVEMFHNCPKIREKYQTQFKYVLIDEYQDTNKAQYILTKHLVAKHMNICVVGDDDQAIYSWRGANVRNILEFEKDYNGTKVIKLEQNYRSTKNILDSAWQVVKHNISRKEKHLWTNKKGGQEVVVSNFADETEEAKFVTEEIIKLTGNNKTNYSSIAVFYRTNAQSRVLEDAFRKEKIPYTVVGTVKFYDRKEIKDIISYLKVMVNPADTISVKRVINIPHRGIGSTTIDVLDKYSEDKKISFWESLHSAKKLNISRRTVTKIDEFASLINQLQDKKNKVSAAELTKLVLKETGYLDELQQEGTFQSKDRIANLKELVSAVSEFEKSENGIEKETTIENFLADVALMSDIDSWSENDVVTLMTLHLAKGLEFQSGFITGMEEGLFPINVFSEENGSHPENHFQNKLEEERRLCYVQRSEQTITQEVYRRRCFLKNPCRF